MKKHLRIAASALVIPFLFSPSAQAATVDATLNVTATVEHACLVTGGNLSFGNYEPLSGAPVNATADFTVTCTLGSTASITLDQGSNPDAASTDDNPVRRMTDGANYLQYNLYSDAGYSQVWGNSPASDVSTVGTGNAEIVTVYGTIPGGQNVPAGNYSDTVTITVTF
jgi:spore coat protein U-like protein